jgi:O-antigen/teichoic acid export membrane protein
VTRLRWPRSPARNVGDRRAISLSFGASVAIQALNAVTGILLARSLGPHGRGELTAVMLWPNLLAVVGSLGIVEAITYHAARAAAPPHHLVGSGLALGLVQSVTLAGAGALVVPQVLGDYGPAAVSSAYLYLAYIPLHFLALYLMAIIGGLHWYGTFQALRMLVILLSAAGVVVVAAAGMLTVRTAVAAYLVANLATALAAAVALRVWRTRPRVDRGLVRRLLAFGARSHGGTVSSTLNERLDQLLISVFLAPASLGLYVVAVTLTSLTSLVGTSTALVALPSVASTPAGPQQLRKARRLIVVTLLCSLAVTGPVLLFLPTLVDVFFGVAYRGAVNPGRVLLAAAVAFSVGRSLGAVLRAVGRPLDAGLAELVALGATVLGLAVLLPLLGLMGAALSSLGAYVLGAGWMAVRLARALRVSPWALLLPDRELLALAPRSAPTRGPIGRPGGGPE